jgi:diadenosine tetraphosphate (Ap4A) HIT family hydrolase
MFQLDPRLDNSSFKIIDLDLSEIRLKNNAHFPWIILIPHVSSDITEIFQLSPAEKKILLDEIARVSKIMNTFFKPDKLNVGALGNIVSQLHIHVIARFQKDLCWPQSVWHDNVPEVAYITEQHDQLINQLRILLS